MSREFLILTCALGLICRAYSQNPDDPHDNPEGLRITYNTNPVHPEKYAVSWSGVADRAYFLQLSEDFLTWTYFPDIIELGGYGPVTYFFDFSGYDQLFVRLKHLAFPGVDPSGEDFDGDKVSTQYELQNGTDPFLPSDSDMEGMSDAWETEYRLNPNDPSDGALDTDEDGVSNSAEYQAGTDPTNYYYNGFPSVFRAASGDFQTAEPGTFSPAPLVIELKNGATPVNNGPITVQIKQGSSGQISETNNGAGLNSVLHLRTNSSGQVAVYFKNPTVVPGGELTSYIQAKIGSAARHGSPQIQEIGEITQVNYTYPLGTVGWHATEAIDARLVGKNPAADLDVFSMQNHGTAVYVRKTSSWCYDLRQAMTCISPWNSRGITGRAGTAITARHVVCAKHFPLDVPDTIRFIEAENISVTEPRCRVIVGTIIGKYDHPERDVSVYTLSSPLPATITPCKVLPAPANYADYLSYLGGGRPPVMCLDKQEKALVHELRALDIFATFAKPVFHTARLPFYEDWEDGDSGNPAFLIINNALVLLATATSDGPGHGAFVSNLSNKTLNDMIAEADADAGVSTGLQVQTVDLSGFSTFTPP